MDLIETLVDLYGRIQNHKATDEEIARFYLEIEKSCMNSETLMNLVKSKYEQKRV